MVFAAHICFTLSNILSPRHDKQVPITSRHEAACPLRSTLHFRRERRDENTEKHGEKD
jgi:hypothetical protein